jgi:NitT/TauT family transport system ATP-binding protein
MSLEIEKINFSYIKTGGKFNLQVNNLILNNNEIVFFHGRSGCGKTTLMNILSGIIQCDISEVVFRHFSSVGYVMHESTMLPWKTIRQNIEIEEKLRKKNINLAKFNELCSSFNIRNGCGEWKASSLSLGMRQRIEIAKAICFNHSLLLLDEALSGIDAETKRVVAEKLLSHTRKNGTTIIATAHHLTDILMLADRVLPMADGCMSEPIYMSPPVEDRISLDAPELLSLNTTKKLLGLN